MHVNPNSMTGTMQAIAEQYFPRLEQQNGIPVRAVDTQDREYTFKYRFWVNNGVVSPGIAKETYRKHTDLVSSEDHIGSIFLDPHVSLSSCMQSRMYLLEGAGELHRAYEMNVGDVMVFAQKPGAPARETNYSERG